MKFVFPLLAILLCGAAAYFTLATSEKFGQVQVERLESIRTNRLVSANADKADTEVTDEKALLETARDNLAVATQGVVALQSDISRLKNETAKLDTELGVQDAEFDQLQKAMEEVQAVFVDIGDDVDIDNLGSKIEEINSDINAKRTRSEELDTLIQGARTSLLTREGDVKRLAERRTDRDRRIARNAMEARVTAVDNDWGFLVIGAGSNSGFTPQTSLLIMRDGRRIGRVTPTSVEATQTIADIDPKTITPGVRIQPGDRVILAKPSAN